MTTMTHERGPSTRERAKADQAARGEWTAERCIAEQEKWLHAVEANAQFDGPRKQAEIAQMRRALAALKGDGATYAMAESFSAMAITMETVGHCDDSANAEWWNDQARCYRACAALVRGYV